MTLPAAGALNRLVTILRPNFTDDGFASVPGEPQPIGQRRAAKTDVSDRERLAASQQGADVTARFVMRYDALTRTIGAADRLLCEGITYTISGAKELGCREGIEVTAARPSA